MKDLPAVPTIPPISMCPKFIFSMLFGKPLQLGQLPSGKSYRFGLPFLVEPQWGQAAALIDTFPRQSGHDNNMGLLLFWFNYS